MAGEGIHENDTDATRECEDSTLKSSSTGSPLQNDNQLISEENRDDAIWELYFKDLLKDGLTYGGLLEIYGCHMFGPDGINKDEASNTGTCSSDDESSIGPSILQPYSAIPNDQTWRLFEKAFRFAMELDIPMEDVSQTKDEKLDSLQTKEHNIFPASRGMRISHEVRYNQIRGRTLHTTEFVPKGTVVWTDSNCGVFSTVVYKGDQTMEIPGYRRFLDYLYNDYKESTKTNDSANNWACDAIMWTWKGGYEMWAINDEKQEELIGEQINLMISFDNGGLFNDSKGGETTNVGNTRGVRLSDFDITPTVYLGRTSGDAITIATRDIQIGEEIRYEYQSGQ